MLHRKLVFTACLSCLTLPGFAKLIRADELPVESRSLELVQINNLIDQLDARKFSKRRQALLALLAFE